MNDNLYDFDNVSDLPTELAARMTSPGGVVNPLVAIALSIVEDAALAGLTVLTIRQIETIAFRTGVEVKSQQSLRGALNVSVTAGKLVKPSRQSYSVNDASTKPVADVTDDAEPAVVGADIDPLA